jgi:hypothetical protein
MKPEVTPEDLDRWAEEYELKNKKTVTASDKDQDKFWQSQISFEE